MKKELSAFVSYMRRKGMRVTQQRLALAKKVFGLHRHFTADELYSYVKSTGVSRATVYRTLSIMVEAGLVKEHKFGSGAKLYEHIIGHSNHMHMVCVNCGAIVEIPMDQIGEQLDEAAKAHDFKILEKDVVIFGLCAKCRDKM